MSDDPNGPDGLDPILPESLLPYESWLEEAHRTVMLKALEHVSLHGLPGEHHFYLTFLTHMPGVEIPARLRERYPGEMTIVLQNQFRDLTINRTTQSISVGLSFGGVPSTLHIPARSVTTFADPHLHLMLRFNPEQGAADSKEAFEQPARIHSFSFHTPEETSPSASQNTSEERKEAEVVSLAAFRKRPTSNNGTPPDENH